MQIDFKVTIWDRITIDESKVSEEVLEKIVADVRSGKIKSYQDLEEYDGVRVAISSDLLTETESMMTVEANGGEDVVYLLDEDGCIAEEYNPTINKIECPLGGDENNNCDGCVYNGEFEFVSGACLRRDRDKGESNAGN